MVLVITVQQLARGYLVQDKGSRSVLRETVAAPSFVAKG